MWLYLCNYYDNGNSKDVFFTKAGLIEELRMLHTSNGFSAVDLARDYFIFVVNDYSWGSVYDTYVLKAYGRGKAHLKAVLDKSSRRVVRYGR